MRGRKPKPTVLHVIAGNPGKRPLREEPEAPGELLDPPEEFNEAQKRIWRRAIANAAEGMLRKIDRELLAVWVGAAYVHASAMEKLAKFGTVIRGPNGGPIPSPYEKIAARHALIMMKAASELGFSPTSRARLGKPATGKTEAQNPFANNGRKPSVA